jgi:hypothetical protein
MLHVVYRSYGGENLKGRPPYYTKLLSLLSLIRALSRIDQPYEIIFLNDGPIPADRLAVMRRCGEVVSREGLGGAGSMRAALRIVAERPWPDSDLVWLAEDDHLYRSNAFQGLLAAANVCPEADYFALYASIGGRAPEGGSWPAWAHVPRNWRPLPAISVNRHPWRRALSTTSTFAARAGALRADRAMMEVVMRLGGAWDHTTCLMYQGHTPSSWKTLHYHYGEDATPKWKALSVVVRIALSAWQFLRRLRGAPRRVIIAPDPPLSTHVESGHLAAGTDWAAVTRSCAAWAKQSGAGPVPANTRPAAATPRLHVITGSAPQPSASHLRRARKRPASTPDQSNTL